MSKLQDIKITAYNFCEQINIEQLKKIIQFELCFSSSTELFYKINNLSFCSFFRFGIAVFAEVDESEQKELLSFIQPYCTNCFENVFTENYQIVQSESLIFDYQSLKLHLINYDVIKIAMFNLAQSVALDNFNRIAEELLDEIISITRLLETKGRLSLKKTKLIKFIGKTLNTKNKISENLYIFDSPEMVWEDEYLEKIHRGLSNFFELQNRFREIELTLKNVQENLDVFLELNHQRESNILEWIIIILILIEVLDMLLSKL